MALRFGDPVRKNIVLAALLVGAAIPSVSSGTACAGEDNRAALVVDVGDEVYRYCVTLTDDSVSGIELIQLAHEQHGLQYRLGDGGQAVCMLANVGAEGDDCFGAYPDFWGYWRGDDNGGWNWSSVGGGSTVVEPGDVEGWAWGSGQDGSSHPAPPPTTFDSVCRPLPEPRKPVTRPQQAAAEEDPDETEAEPAAEPDDGSDESGSSGSRERALDKVRGERTDPGPEVTAEPEPTDALDPAATGATEDEPQDGLPVAGLVALVVAAVLGAVGFLVTKRRGA